ncbi:hypothetical protein ACFXPY_38620 [Streptomyces sp. NPDC059153]|uniref:hypothetical protein n=1 Tax=Streptomyces sp. NPDC059153 TaxID=3346743 RepID=UPI0036960B55
MSVEGELDAHGAAPVGRWGGLGWVLAVLRRPEAVAGADWSAVCPLPEQAVRASSPRAAAIAD